MRLKKEAMLSFVRSDAGQPKVVVEAHKKYQGISQVLEEHPGILDRVHADVREILSASAKGRGSDYSSDTILRTLIVQVVEGQDFRGAVVQIADNEFLRDFVRLGNRRVMDFTFLNRCSHALRPETWKAINDLLARSAAKRGWIDPSEIRADCTVVEANIHYPTDSSLLWDSWRVLSRWLRRGRALARDLVPHRFHDRKTKKLHEFISRYAASPSKGRQRQVKATFRTFIAKVRGLADAAEAFGAQADARPGLDLAAVAEELRALLPSVRTVIQTAERSQIQGQTVPARDRVFSLFEPHVELIKRGKRSKPVEFGHQVLLAQTRQKFITDYDVLEESLDEAELTEPVVTRHKKLFGAPPKALTADQGFHPVEPVRERVEAQVQTLAIPRRLADWGDKVMALFQKFRAGIEGSISVLKRAFRLMRCLSKGFKHFRASVGQAIFCHNLVVLARCRSA